MKRDKRSKKDRVVNINAKGIEITIWIPNAKKNKANK
jgi:hypothetical protein